MISKVHKAVLAYIKELLGQVIERYTCFGEKYHYKLCLEKYLIITEDTENTINNETRKNIINKDYANYRASEQKTIDIININDFNDKPEFINNSYFDAVNNVPFTVQYRIGSITKAENFNHDIASVFTGGIHYYKKPERALFNRNVPKDYTGGWIYWCSDGQKAFEGRLINGLKHGSWTITDDRNYTVGEKYYNLGKRCTYLSFLLHYNDAIKADNQIYPPRPVKDEIKTDIDTYIKTEIKKYATDTDMETPSSTDEDEDFEFDFTDSLFTVD
jgi:hypothetical protein